MKVRRQFELLDLLEPAPLTAKHDDLMAKAGEFMRKTNDDPLDAAVSLRRQNRIVEEGDFHPRQIARKQGLKQLPPGKTYAAQKLSTPFSPENSAKVSKRLSPAQSAPKFTKMRWRLMSDRFWKPSPWLVGFAALAGGCQHSPISSAPEVPSRSPCAYIDWFETGRTDGRAGAPSRLATYQARCNQTPYPVKAETYITGRETGLVEYCSAEGGLEAGKSLKPYEKVCPENLEPEFLKQYELGRRIQELENDRSELEDRIANLKQLLPARMSPEAQAQSSIQAQIEQLKTRQAKISQDLSALESKTDGSSRLE